MLKFDEEKQIASVQGALALRQRIEAIVDEICEKGFRNLCWLGIGGTWASCLQAEVHMKERSDLELFVENAAEYLTTGSRRVGDGTIVVISSVTGSTRPVISRTSPIRCTASPKEPQMPLRAAKNKFPKFCPVRLPSANR